MLFVLFTSIPRANNPRDREREREIQTERERETDRQTERERWGKRTKERFLFLIFNNEGNGISRIFFILFFITFSPQANNPRERERREEKNEGTIF